MDLISRSAVKSISLAALPLRHPTSTDYSQLLKAIGDAEIVMIGEASHGTHDFYAHRAEISKQLIEQKGFNFIVTEADWPDAYRVNRFVRSGRRNNDQTAEESLSDFKRFPLWMWRNTVVRDFIEWLRNYNDQFEDQKNKCGYYGMDLYSFWTSMDEVVKYLEKVSPKDAEKTKKRYANFDRFQGNEQAYGYASAIGRKSYEKEVVSILTDLQRKGPEYMSSHGGFINGEELFYATENARLVKNAEEYYRLTYVPGTRTWNLRDSHMVECVLHLREHLAKEGKTPKGIIWAHNSHLGDARATESFRRGEWNVGQLLRERLGMDKTFIVGFNSFKGSVTAAHQWDSPAKFMKVRNGLWNSWEHFFHLASEQMSSKDYYLILRSLSKDVNVPSDLIKALAARRIQRYIGVIYRPESEKASHYSWSDITQQYDALLYIDSTDAIEPLDPPAKWKVRREEFRADPDPFPELNGFSKLERRSEIKEEDLIRIGKEIELIGTFFFEEGNIHLAKEKFNKALSYILHNYAKHAENPQIETLRCSLLGQLAACEAKLENWNHVIEHCNRILLVDEKNINALSMLGQAYEAKGRPDLAESAFKRVRKK